MIKFAYEDLEVWSKAVDFSVKVIDIVDSLNTSRNIIVYWNRSRHLQLPFQPI